MLLRADGRVAHSNTPPLRGDLRQSEIENLRLPSIRDEDVSWLDIPVDDSFRMCRVESVGDLDAQIEHRLDLHRLASDAVPECLPLQQFHGDEGSPIDLIYFVDGADVWMVQRGRSLGLPLETVEGLRIIGEFVGQELQGDVATELEVFGLIHHTHAPAADPAE